MIKFNAEWILRVAVAGEFLGHGAIALGGNATWVKWIIQFTGAMPETAATLLTIIGAMDIVVGIFVFIRPIRAVLLWATFWGFWTALVRPLVGESIWQFVERFPNWGAPLALLLLHGWPKKRGEWLK